MADNVYPYSPGLDGVPACKSVLGYVDGVQGVLEYLGYPIETLAEHSTFEETCFLLLHQRLPSKSEFEAFSKQLKSHMTLSPELRRVIESLPAKGHPMLSIQAVVAAAGMCDAFPAKSTPQERLDVSLKIIALMPQIVGAFHRVRTGQPILAANPELSLAGNFIYCTTGHVPSSYEARVLDACFILHAEHSLNASTFTGRVVASTLADPYAVISSAIGALNGPLHGGANEAVMKMLHDIGSVSAVRPYVEAKISKKEKIMGVGHRIYKTKDPRAIILQKLAADLFQTHKNDDMLAIALELEKVVQEKLAAKGIYPNVDFFSGLVYSALKIPEDLYTCIFAAARTAGWLAHYLEQLVDNRIYRPDQVYEGKHAQTYVPISQRS